jgi:hypothetical protein
MRCYPDMKIWVGDAFKGRDKGNSALRGRSRIDNPDMQQTAVYFWGL